MKQEDKEQEYENLIEAWSEQGLSVQQNSEFEQKRQNDPEFEAYFRQHQKMLATLQQNRKEVEFKDMLQEIKSELKQEGFFESVEQEIPELIADMGNGVHEELPTVLHKRISIWIRMRPYLAIAASFLLIVTIAVWWNYRQAAQEAKLKAIYALDRLTIPIKNGNLGALDSGKDPFELYSKGHLDEAIRIMQERYDNSAGEDTEASYWLAIFKIKKGDRTGAIKLLNRLDEVSRIPESIYPAKVEEVRWHLALALAAEGAWRRAESLLKEIENINPNARDFLNSVKK